jgi:hypothetical protein
MDGVDVDGRGMKLTHVGRIPWLFAAGDVQQFSLTILFLSQTLRRTGE